MKNLLITGEIQIGKSTLLRKLLTLQHAPHHSLHYAGFRTYPKMNQQRKEGFLIAPFPADLTSVEPTLITHWLEEHQCWHPHTEVFDQLGVKILQHALNAKPDLIIMDELGHFESAALRFQTMVEACLESEIPVIAVVKQKSTPFLDRIRQRSDSILVNVTKENRNQLVEECLEKVPIRFN